MCDADDLSKYFIDHDCVLSALGSPPGFTTKKLTFELESMKAIIEAMRKSNVRRVVTVGAHFSKRKISHSIKIISKKSTFCHLFFKYQKPVSITLGFIVF